MRHLWLYTLSFVVACVFASTAEAQRFPQLLNMNTHEGKYATGGVGFSLGVGAATSSNFRRESASSEVINGALEAVFVQRETQAMTRFIFGAAFDFQIGADSDIIGTNFGLRIFNMSIGTNSTRNPAAPPGSDAIAVFEDINESVTLMYAGFNFTINFYKSEFIEADGRRTRQDWGLAMIFGPKIGFMMGDFSDLNGLASAGLDIGVMADFPIPIPGAEDLLSISPYMWFEVNYRFNVDNGLVDSFPGSPTNGQAFINGNFDFGFWQRTEIDIDGDEVVDIEGIAVRRHNFIPAYAMNIGVDANLTPIFLSRSGTIINNWRFHTSLVITVPLSLNFFAADYVGAGLWSSAETYPIHFTISFGAAYMF